jgi:hypothetical protein
MLAQQSTLLDGLEAIRPSSNAKASAYKTVDTFSGITQRKLWLKHDTNGPARTDGHCITADLNDPDMYRMVEHEISHVLFKSDATAKVHFVQTYSARVCEYAATEGVSVNKAQVQELVDFTLNLIEDCRVDSLWALLYPGSAALLRELHRAMTQEYAQKAHASYLLYFACVESGVATPPGPLDVPAYFRYRA